MEEQEKKELNVVDIPEDDVPSVLRERFQELSSIKQEIEESRQRAKDTQISAQ